MKILNLKDLEQYAASKIEKPVFDYWQSGAHDLLTLRENSAAFDRYRIRGRTMINVAQMDISPKIELFGHKYSVPVGIAPSANHILANPDGEQATAAACEAVNVPMGLSSFSNFSVDDVHNAAPHSAVFFQLYLFKNRKFSELLIRRAEQASFKAVLLTSDTPYVGQRYADKYNDFQLPKDIRMGNFEGLGKKVPHPVERKDEAKSEGLVIDPGLTWNETVKWLKSVTKMQIWAKGVVVPEDAEAAIAEGIDGIWVSNHGGRQLDSTLPTIEALSDVVDAVNKRVPVHVDGGFRSGGDIFKALAIGADFVWVGRPALWGLAYGGQKGVELMLHMLQEDLKLVMALAGTPTGRDITRKCILRYGPRLEKL